MHLKNHLDDPRKIALDEQNTILGNVMAAVPKISSSIQKMFSGSRLTGKELKGITRVRDLAKE